MKLKHIALAVASISALPAFAAVGSINALYGVTPARTIYFSGASALSGSLAAAVTKNCTGGAANIRSLTAGGSTSAGRVIVCTSSAIDGSFTGPFAVVKRDTNGSFDGVGPVISQSNLKTWADVTAATTAGCDNVALNCTLDTTTNIKPNAGLTDVDTNVWVGMSATGALSSANPVPALNSTTTVAGGFAGQGFGIMASEELYKAMQTKQKAEGTLPATCVVGNFTAGECQPSISKAQYAAVVDGGNFAYIANGAISGDANPINLCKRVETSGTQAVSNVYFLNNSCSNASPTFGSKPPKFVDLVNSPTAVVFNTANIVGNYDDFGGAFGLFEGSGTGDARNCVINRNNGQNPNKVADALGKYALGFLSLENAPAAGWKYLKLDGVSPNANQTAGGWVVDANQRINVINGVYDISPEFEMLWNKPTTATAFSTALNTFMTTLKNEFANPATLNTRGIFQANGAFTNAAFPTQVHKGTRGGNFCAPQALAE